MRFVRTIVVREPSQAIYLMFFKPWTAVVGAHEALSRAPSLVAAVLTTFLVVLLGCRLFDLATGVLAGLLLATNASFIEWSQYVRIYTVAALAAVVTTYLFVRATVRTDTRSWLVYGLAARSRSTATSTPVSWSSAMPRRLSSAGRDFRCGCSPPPGP